MKTLLQIMSYLAFIKLFIKKISKLYSLYLVGKSLMRMISFKVRSDFYKFKLHFKIDIQCFSSVGFFGGVWGVDAIFWLKITAKEETAFNNFPPPKV